MSDIRSFFGKPRTSAGTSALTQVKKDIQSVNDSPVKRHEKIVPKSAAARKTDKHFEDIVDIDEDSSAGESPLPSSLRKKVQAKQKTKMRKRILISSGESEDDFSLPPSRKRTPAKPSPSPQKQRPGKQKLDLNDDSFSPVKPKSKKKVMVDESDHDERSDELIRAVSEAEEEEEDEFVEKKKQRKGKKQLSTGQKKLSFSSQPVESHTKKDKENTSAQSNSQQLKRINAADFFGTTFLPTMKTVGRIVLILLIVIADSEAEILSKCYKTHHLNSYELEFYAHGEKGYILKCQLKFNHMQEHNCNQVETEDLDTEPCCLKKEFQRLFHDFLEGCSVDTDISALLLDSFNGCLTELQNAMNEIMTNNAAKFFTQGKPTIEDQAQHSEADDLITRNIREATTKENTPLDSVMKDMDEAAVYVICLLVVTLVTIVSCIFKVICAYREKKRRQRILLEREEIRRRREQVEQ